MQSRKFISQVAQTFSLGGIGLIFLATNKEIHCESSLCLQSVPFKGFHVISFLYYSVSATDMISVEVLTHYIRYFCQNKKYFKIYTFVTD